MACPNCGSDPVVFDVPPEYREHAPETVARVALCPACLTLWPAASAEPTELAFDRIDNAFPTDGTAVPLALGIGLLESVALNRSSLEALFSDVEAGGVDPLLLLDRLSVQEGVSPAFDLERRRHQLEQILE